MKERSKNKIQNTLTIKDAYKEYKKNIKVKSSVLNVDYATYRKICETFNVLISKKILYESYEFNIPYRLGKLRIKKFKMKIIKEKLRIDYKLTKQYKKAIYHLNEHTNNYAYRWLWDKDKAITIGKRVYTFVATRDNKRELASILTNKELLIDYFE